MRTRNLLHHRKLDEFLRWATVCGFDVSFPPAHTYQAAMLRRGQETPIIIYRRDHGEHLTTYGPGTALVLQWIDERKAAA